MCAVTCGYLIAMAIFFLRSTLVQVLVVQEKYSASSLLGAWKLPTGFVHAVRIQAEGTWY
jgi:hypothetical protein